MKITKLLFVTISFMFAAGICLAGESLEAKLAKLDAKIKAKQSIAKISKTETVDKQASKKKSLDERIAELQARQNEFSKTATGRDVKLSSFESKLAALKAKIVAQKQEYAKSVSGTKERFSTFETKLASIDTKVETLQNDEALINRIALLEQKIATMEEHAAVVQVKSDSQAADKDVTGKLEVKRGTLKPAKTLDMYELAPVAANFLATTEVASKAPADDIWNRETLTNGFAGLGDKLSDYGIDVGLSMTNIYQINARGGTNTTHHQGRHTGSYDLEAEFDLEKLLGIKGGTLFMHGEGSWSHEDIDSRSIGSAFGANADAAGRRSMDLTELWYEQAMLDDTLRFRFGKMDIGGGFECRGCPVSFDGSAFANDETAQFLNGALVNNATIPFPDKGIGAVLYWNPVESWYASVGVIDAEADARETGLNTAFSEEDYYFYVAETGITPRFKSANGELQGAYRIGIWNDPQPKVQSDGDTEYRDDVGFYTSCDQMLYKENSDAEDTQGLGTFFRYGRAQSKTNDITNFYSGGFQYQGLFDGRDDDVLGVGYAHGVFSDKATTTYTEDYESVLEIYYNAQITPWLNLSPSMQYIANPGGVEDTQDAVVFAIRAQMTF